MSDLVGFYRCGGYYEAEYESIRTGATVRLRVRTLERAEAEDKSLRERGYAPILRVSSGESTG